MSTTLSPVIDPRGATRAIARTIQRLEQRFDATAANLANVGTAGHKRLIARSRGDSDGSFAAQARSAAGSLGIALSRDFSQGDLVYTDGDKSRLALQGDGFFAVEKDGELRYSRTIKVLRAADGTLTDLNGASLLGEGGPIRLPDALADFTVESDGTVKARTEGREETVGKLRIVDFPDRTALADDVGGLFSAPDTLTPSAAAGTQVVQGAYERANVDAVRELVDLIVIQRQYDAAQRALATESELRQRLTQQLSQ